MHGGGFGLSQFHNSDAVLTLAVTAGAEGFDVTAALAVGAHGISHRAGALAMDDGDRLQFTHHGGVQITLQNGDGLVGHHAPQVDLGGDGGGLRLWVFRCRYPSVCREP